MKATWKIIKEQLSSFYLIQRLAFFEIKSDNNNNYLGFLWELLSPMIQIAVYWFVFGTIRHGRKIVGFGDIPFIDWMLAGVIAWFFINHAILMGTKSIYSRIRMISKMSFPMSVIPTYVIFSKYYSHIALTAIVYIILKLSGVHFSWYILQIPYYMISLLILLFSITLVTSTLATIVRDVTMIVQSLLRVLLYLTPILWQPSFSWKVMVLLKLNPFYYIVEGYRYSLLGKSWYFIDHGWYTLYFWCFILVVLTIGSILHLKFRDHFVDYL